MVVRDGRVRALELVRTEQDTDGAWQEDEDQTMRIKVDFIISAFGSQLGFDEVSAAMEPLKFHSWGAPVVDTETMCSSEPGVFVGGDLAGTAAVCRLPTAWSCGIIAA